MSNCKHPKDKVFVSPHDPDLWWCEACHAPLFAAEVEARRLAVEAAGQRPNSSSA